MILLLHVKHNKTKLSKSSYFIECQATRRQRPSNTCCFRFRVISHECSGMVQGSPKYEMYLAKQSSRKQAWKGVINRLRAHICLFWFPLVFFFVVRTYARSSSKLTLAIVLINSRMASAITIVLILHLKKVQVFVGSHLSFCGYNNAPSSHNAPLEPTLLLLSWCPVLHAYTYITVNTHVPRRMYINPSLMYSWKKLFALVFVIYDSPFHRTSWPPTFPFACARRSHRATQQIEHQKRGEAEEHRTSQGGAFRPGTDLDPIPRPVGQDLLVRRWHPNMPATTHHITQSRGQV